MRAWFFTNNYTNCTVIHTIAMTDHKILGHLFHDMSDMIYPELVSVYRAIATEIDITPSHIIPKIWLGHEENQILMLLIIVHLSRL